MINSIGPFWDGNEVWLLTAGGATFAAFPEWYATLFSGFYLALFLILVALIVRGVAFEYRGKHDSPVWRAWWDRAIFFGSVVPALLWGVAFANIVHGVPIDADHEFTGSLLTLLNPYGLIGGVASLSLFTLSGAIFLTLRTKGELLKRCRSAAGRIAWVAPVIVFGFLAWTYINALSANETGIVPGVIPLGAVALVIATPFLVNARREGWAFVTAVLSVALIVATMFLNLFPRVMPSSTNSAFDLTIWNASSTHYTLVVMSVVAVILTPVVLLYQGWTYYVFRQRLSADDLSPIKNPIELLGKPFGDHETTRPSGD